MIVKLKTSGEIRSKMNFNLLICHVQFIDKNNDALVISKPSDVESVTIGNTDFFYNNGYFQVLSSTDSIKLVVLRKVSLAPIKIGAFGIPDYSGTGIQTYTSVVTTVGEKKLVMKEEVESASVTNYFLTSNGVDFKKANKESFIELFPSKKDAIQSFIKQNKISFAKEADLQKLFQFCASK